MILVNVHETPNGKLIAVCDEELLGRRFSEGNKELDLDRYADFYRGEAEDEDVFADGLDPEDFYTVNAIGERATGVFIKKGIVKKSQVDSVQGIPFVYICRAFEGILDD